MWRWGEFMFDMIEDAFQAGRLFVVSYFQLHVADPFPDCGSLGTQQKQCKTQASERSLWLLVICFVVMVILAHSNQPSAYHKHLPNSKRILVQST
jgi:hypothetical protein